MGMGLSCDFYYFFFLLLYVNLYTHEPKIRMYMYANSKENFAYWAFLSC